MGTSSLVILALNQYPHPEEAAERGRLEGWTHASRRALRHFVASALLSMREKMTGSEQEAFEARLSDQIAAYHDAALASCAGS
jgi:hypothetical protein